MDFYIATQQNDKAWSFLNKLSFNEPSLIDHVRLAQCRILKKEKKFDEALAILMAYFMYKNKWNNVFQRDMFLRDASVIFKNLGIATDDERRRAAADIVESQISKRTYDETVLRKELYERIIKDLNNEMR